MTLETSTESPDVLLEITTSYYISRFSNDVIIAQFGDMYDAARQSPDRSEASWGAFNNHG